MPDWPIVALALFGYLAFVTGVTVLIFRVSGWYALSKAYPRPISATPGERRWGVSGKIGRIASNRALIVGTDQGGLYLSYIPPFSLVAPALYIPWTALHFERRWKSWWTSKVRYRTAIGVPIELYGHAAEFAALYAPELPAV